MLIKSYLPPCILTNEDLAHEYNDPKWSASMIYRKTGIQSRHVVEEELVSDLAVKAAESLLAEYKIARDSIDFLVLCTQSPDYFLPTTACIVQHRLELPTHTGAFDFNLGCSGFIYGLAICKGLLLSEIASNVLLIMSETYSRYVHPMDKSTRTIFGDAASAIFLAHEDIKRIGQCILGSDGSGAGNLIVPAGGRMLPRSASSFRQEIDASGNVRTQEHIYMNGPEIFSFTLRVVPDLVNDTLRQNGLNLDDIDFFIFHQANRYILETLREKMDIPSNKFCIDMANTGNTVSATIPLALQNAIERNLIHKGSKVLLVGFGVGYSWGATVLSL
ncbi:MAG: ketoacyl-ACP synthase III [Synergistota bacterium]|nr:ketoacyl-ACP synthase III [Synergistota bacterium]